MQSFFDKRTLVETSQRRKTMVSDFFFWCLGGLVKVEGSAKYLRETIESKDIANVFMQAEYLTRTETMPAETPLSNIQLCKRKDITHIVTRVEYGMSANFDFRTERASEETREEIEGKLKLAIDKIPAIKVEADVAVSEYSISYKNFSPLKILWQYWEYGIFSK